LVLLTISFPRLKIIWSSSPFNTVEIFRDLKETREEPDADKAVLVGGDEADGGAAAEGTAEAGFLQAPQDILRSLPGITSKNYHHVMSKVDSIDRLVELELKEVQELVGVEAGRTLFSFINREMTSAS
jgi:DNA excision repair protein ERCC-4